MVFSAANPCHNRRMQYSRKKITAAFVLVAMLTLISGVCYGTFASASMTNDGSMPMMDSLHCGGQTAVLRQAVPMGDAVMPCCIDRHDNVPTTLPVSLNSSVHFSGILTVLMSADSVSYGEQKTFASSSSPPPRPDELSSLMKKE